MKKDWKYWLVAVAIVLAAIVFVKLAPLWTSVAGLVSFCVGFAAGWFFGNRKRDGVVK